MSGPQPRQARSVVFSWCFPPLKLRMRRCKRVLGTEHSQSVLGLDSPALSVPYPAPHDALCRAQSGAPHKHRRLSAAERQSVDRPGSTKNPRSPFKRESHWSFRAEGTPSLFVVHACGNATRRHAHLQSLRISRRCQGSFGKTPPCRGTGHCRPSRDVSVTP